jgi:hypothetical protein
MDLSGDPVVAETRALVAERYYEWRNVSMDGGRLV